MHFSRCSSLRSQLGKLAANRLEYGLTLGFILSLVIWSLSAINSAPVEAAQQGVATVSAASYEPLVAPDSIATAFGSRLATQTALATPGQPLPPSLGGTTVEVSGRRAALFFVTPTQIAFLIPPETELGLANIIVRSGDGVVSTGTVRVATVATGVFSANSNGRGLPAANLLRVKPDGAQSNELLYVRDALKSELVAIKANPGPEGERLFLILFLTGLRGAPDPDRNGNSNESVRVSLGGVESQPLYAGRQGDFAGLDQLNIELPRSLIGRGLLNIAVSVTTSDGSVISNTVQIEMAATAVNSTPPTATAGSDVTPEDVARNFTLRGSGPAGQPLNFILTSLPPNGQLSGAAPNLTYTPKRDFNGVERFTFRVRSDTAFSNEAAFDLIVQRVNDPPVLIVPGSQTVNLGERLSFIVSATNPDQGETLSFSLLENGSPPGATIMRGDTNSSVRFSWTPTAESVGKTYITGFRVEDNDDPGARLSDTKTVTITTGTLWGKTSGPEGGVVNSLLSIGSNLYAGTDSGGVFRSPDQGNTWAAANNGLGDFGVNVVFAAGSGLVAGTKGGIYLSLDQGQNWSATNISDLRVFDFAANGANLFAATDSSVRISTDGGRNWTNTNNNDLPFEIAEALVVKAGLVFVGSTDSFFAGLFVSSTNGQNWTPVRGGLPKNGEVGVSSLAATPTHLFALTTDLRLTSVYASANNGQSWAIANTGLPTNVRKLFANGSTAYAAADNRIFASTDGGRNWAQINTVFTARQVTALGFTTDRLIAGSSGDGVFASTDSGRNFVTANQGFTNSSVSAFALNDDQSKLFAATNRGVAVTTNNGVSYGIANRGLPNGNLAISALAAPGAELFAATSGGVFRSVEQGGGWQAVNNGLPSSGVLGLVALGGRLFAGTGAGVFVSANQGQSWSPVNSGLANLSVAALVLNGARLLAGTGDGVFAFTDQTQSWSRVGALSFSVKVLAAAGQFIVASGSTGIKVTEDGGMTWRDVVEGLTQSPTALAIRGTTAYGGISLGSFGDGVFALSTGADKWAAVNESLTNLAVNALIVSGDNLFAGTNDGVSLSAITDQSWKISGAELASLNINALLARETDATGATELFAANVGRVFRSVNQGQSWESLPLPAPASINALHTTGGALLAGTDANGVYRSFDRGGSWVSASAGLNSQIIRAFAANNAFLFTATPSGVYRSTNQGQNWERAVTGLPTLLITSLLRDGDAVFAGTDDSAVFVTNNGGQSWSDSRAGLGNAAMRSLGNFRNILFAGSYRNGLFRSTDGGRNWSATSADLPGISSFAASGNKLYAAGVYGVFVSIDQGLTWRQINAGLTKTSVNALAVIGDKLFAGTSNGGVFVSQIPE